LAIAPLSISMKKYEINILIRLQLLVLTISAAAFLLLNNLLGGSILVILVVIYQIYELFRFISKSNQELEDFVQSIHYRDFTRQFDVKNAPETVKDLRKGFNEINSTFKLISKEKETQFLYLQKILELVDTGILSYDMKSEEVIWLNEAFKKMMGIPYLKTIQSLEKRDASLFANIVAIKPKETKITTVTNNKNAFKILLTATAFQVDDHIYKLIAFQNINDVVDETESQAWHKLLSVMTHEIMNSIAPIASLANTMSRQLSAFSGELSAIRREPSALSDEFYAISYQPSAVSSEQATDGSELKAHRSMLTADSSQLIADLKLGIETIQKRSEGLLKFAETYRNLNKISQLNLKTVYVRDIFENLYQLMNPSLESKNIELDIILKDPHLKIEVDINLVEQALINLIVNAVEAVKDKTGDRIIQLSATAQPNQKTILSVSDNGLGMSAEVQDQIFIPFFSTRKTGSGIGLSLCKQIMMLHKGSIQVQSTEGVGSVFSLVF
jgi:two-component system, NtrC family, nitrogen regulation sensor histidine kinase NtrY